MKKIILLLITIVSLYSCSSNDENETTDAIIGTWQLNSYTEIGVERSDECSRKTTINFSENGIATVIGFENDGNSCKSETYTMNWKNSGDSNYTFDTNDGQTHSFKITFSQNNSVFSILLKSEVVNGETWEEIEAYKKI